jgi:hypothetical protein
VVFEVSTWVTWSVEEDVDVPYSVVGAGSVGATVSVGADESVALLKPGVID